MQPDLKKKLNWITFLRVLVITTLVMSTLLSKEQSDALFWQRIQGFMLGIAGFTYFVTFCYFLALWQLKSLRNLTILAYVQIFIDVLINGSLVFLTGGATSLFTFLFSLTIINASILLYRPGAVVAAIFSTVSYGMIILMELKLLAAPKWIELSITEDIYNSISINVVTFIAVAMLAGQLSEQLRTTRSRLEESEISLADLRLLNNLIVNSVHIAILTMALDHRIIVCNQWVRELTGHAPDHLTNKNLADVFPELRPLLSEIRTVRHREMDLKRADGGQLLTRISVFPLKNHAGESIGRVLTIQDITTFREMELRMKQSERLAAIGELAAGIAHEIRNPLAAISGSVQLMQDNKHLPPDEQRLMKIVIKETDFLNELITDFLAFAKPTTMEIQTANLVEVIDETLKLFVNNEAYSSRMTVRRTGSDKAFVSADLRKMRQVFWNLLTNAAEAMPDGGTIVVDVDEQPGADLILIEITDSGSGIAEADIPRIFDPFFTTKATGTGLGLATVHTIVEGHGGQILARNHGQGTTFRLTLPRAGSEIRELSI